jgi:tripartite-type tricarboxylate transporter receptor subunit TctC
VGHSKAIPSAPYIKDGTLRALAIASARRSEAFPDVPTLAETGIPNQEAGFVGGVVAPAGTPENIVDLLHKQIVRIVALPDVKERLAKLDFDPVANTPEEFGTWIKDNFNKWREVVRAANIRID